MGFEIQTTGVVDSGTKRPSRAHQGWINLVLAALAMTATLPGRTHGLGLITKDLTTDTSLDISAGTFNVMNFWAVLLGSAMCLPVGRLIDRLGVRGVLVGVSLGLGLAVIGMSAATGVVLLFVALTMVRGLGQGALSVVSIAMIGKWFTRKLPGAMAVFTVLLAFGFMIANFAVGLPVEWFGWRPAWMGLGLFLMLVLAPLGGLLVRSSPEAVGLVAEPMDTSTAKRAPLDVPLGVALKSPGFWAFALATSFFNLPWAAVTLHNEVLLEDHHLDKQTSVLVLGVMVVSGLPANLLCGWLAQKWPLGRLLGAGMLVFAGSLAIFPYVSTTLHAVLYAAVLGAAGGIITVIFFTAFGFAFGRRHLGAIQATVQIFTVFASAIGPVLLHWSKEKTGGYTQFFQVCTGIAVVLGIAAWVVPLRRAGCSDA
jgi:MFS family permease